MTAEAGGTLADDKPLSSVGTGGSSPSTVVVIVSTLSTCRKPAVGVVVTEEVLAVELQDVGDPKELLEEALKDALLPL